MWVVVACGGADPIATPPPGESTEPTESTPTESTPPEDTGWECNDWYPCQDCGGIGCSAEITACAGDGACGPALNAWAACVLDCGDPPVCAATFTASGGAAASALLACTEASCAAECGL
jgi:hypothetical protein